MKLTILGSGSSWPDPARRESAFHIEEGDFHFLVDAGEGCTESMVRFGLDWAGLDGAFLTHFHNDHVAGLIPLLFRMYIFADRKKPFFIYGPPGLDRYIQNQTDGLADWLDTMPFDLVQNLLQDRARLQLPAGMTADAYEVVHKKTTLGFRFACREKVVSFSGDTILCDALFPLAENADLFVCEAGKPEGGEIENHITWTQIGQVAARAKVKTLVLTHFNRYLQEEKLVSAIGKEFKGEIIPAYDGMEIFL